MKNKSNVLRYNLGQYTVVKYESNGQHTVYESENKSNHTGMLSKNIPTDKLVSAVVLYGIDGAYELDKKYNQKYQKNTIKLHKNTTEDRCALYALNPKGNQTYVTKKMPLTKENLNALLDLKDDWNNNCLDELGTGKVIVPSEFIKKTKDAIFHFEKKKIVFIEKENVSDMSDEEVSKAYERMTVEDLEKLEKENRRLERRYDLLKKKTTKTCPFCGAKLTPKYNAKQDKWFMGCSKYPTSGCSFTRNCVGLEAVLLIQFHKRNQKQHQVVNEKLVQSKLN